VSRAVTRAATTGLAGLVTVLLTAAPALAENNPIGPAEGSDPAGEISLGKNLLVYFGVPLLGFLLVASVAWLPGAVRANRYRPAKGWSASPVWFAGPADPGTAVAAAAERGLGDVVRGGASGSW
jgi:hypothetical protein